MLNTLKLKIDKVLDILHTDLATIRTGRATPSLVENIVINAYGGTQHLKVIELATIVISDSQTLLVTPYDQAIIHEIEKGIHEANVGLNPVVDGQIVRISVPSLSEERRQELIKLMKHKLENGRVMVRQSRHEAMNDIKKSHADKQISDDDMLRMEKETQRVIDEAMEHIDSMGKHKESELLQI
ncbi:MAG: ribosome recycling factor [Candidatus Levybacteria bacterium]|nr:ribosome recycling factor [Candidatus Levybacteria bacterium]